MTLSDVHAALLTVTENVHHFEADEPAGNYIVWAENGQGDSIWANGEMLEQSISGTIDYFTKMEFDPAFNAIQKALSDAGISFYLKSTQFETDTKFIHYEWSFEVQQWQE